MEPVMKTVERWSPSHRVHSHSVQQEPAAWNIHGLVGACCQVLRRSSSPDRFRYKVDQDPGPVLRSSKKGNPKDAPKVSMADITTKLNDRVAGQSAEDHVDRPEDITLAIEVKYLVPLLKPGAVDPEPHDTRHLAATPDAFNEEANQQLVAMLLAGTISKVGENAVDSKTIKNSKQKQSDFWDSSWIIKKANSPVPSPGEKTLEGYIWVPVEVVSPKMLAKDPSTTQRLSRVIEGLVSAHRLVANYSCDTHCHLGRRDDRPYAFSTLKRLATLLWPAEDALRSIRDPKSPNYNNIYTWGFEMKYSRLGQELRELRGKASEACVTRAAERIPDKQVVEAIVAQEAMPTKELRAFEKIWEQDSYEALGRLLSGDQQKYRRLGFNFSAFGLEDERARTNPRTMEFRFMEGTLRADLVLGWAVICSTIVEVAELRSDSRYEMALKRLLQNLNDGCSMERHLEARGQRLGRIFQELMEDLGVPIDIYRELHKKVITEN